MIPLKYISLIVLVVFSSLNVLLIRYSRSTHIPNEPIYIASTAVLLSEVLKLVISIAVITKQAKKVNEIANTWKDGLKLLVPASLYVVQNNLLYIALSNLDAATYQVTYQLKILTTAFFSIAMLKKHLDRTKWISLVVLMFGVILVQWQDENETTQSKDDGLSSKFIGLISILLACLSSGFSGVYFEKIIKGSPTSLWIRNLQLAFFSTIIGIIGVLLNDFDKIKVGGFFQGYNAIVLAVIVSQSLTGLMIGAVVKYADNILKGFATSVSIIVSSSLSYFILSDFEPSLYFMLGGSAVLLATYLYSLPSNMSSK